KQVALLRGINVGGKHKLPMNSLISLFIEAGCHDVATFIQSGNVLFRASPPLAAQLPNLIEKQIEAQFGFRAPIILRTRKELKGAVNRNPFTQVGADENALYVMFLADRPDSARIASLDPQRSPP